jgi:hypothetical protein
MEIDQITIMKHYTQELFFNRTHKSSHHSYHPTNGARFVGSENEIYARITVYKDCITDEAGNCNIIDIRIALILDIYKTDIYNNKESIGSEIHEVNINDPTGIDFFFNKIEVLLLKYKMDNPFVVYGAYYFVSNSTTSSATYTSYAAYA